MPRRSAAKLGESFSLGKTCEMFSTLKLACGDIDRVSWYAPFPSSRHGSCVTEENISTVPEGDGVLKTPEMKCVRALTSKHCQYVKSFRTIAQSSCIPIQPKCRHCLFVRAAATKCLAT